MVLGIAKQLVIVAQPQPIALFIVLLLHTLYISLNVFALDNHTVHGAATAG